MKEERYGRIRVVRGENDSAFPGCTSLVIEDDTRTIVDPGCGPEAIGELLAEGPFDRVVNTHFHFDHINGNYLLDGTPVWLNNREAPCFRELSNIPSILGIVEVYGEDAGERWVEEVKGGEITSARPTPSRDKRWYLSTRRLDGTYDWYDDMDFGHTKATVLPAPGHSLGNCFLFFPDEKLVYTGDVDITKFGPWYGGSDGDINEFTSSAFGLVDLEADHFVTGHEVGVLDLDEFMYGLGEYLEVIDRREERVFECIEKGMELEEMSREGICYPRLMLDDPWAYMWEKIMVKKHVRRLVSGGEIQLELEKVSRLLKDTEPLSLKEFGFDVSRSAAPGSPEDEIPLDLGF